MSGIFRNSVAAAALAAAAAFAPAAEASTLSITSITGNWTFATPPGVEGIGTSTISWGEPVTPGGSQSSYVFSPAVPLPTGTAADTPFGLGLFTHNNFPINGVFLETAELRVDVQFVLDDDPGTTLSVFSVFDFVHEETTNDLNPCPYGGANAQGVNINGCADRVTAALNVGASTSFIFNGEQYFFNLLGFCSDCPVPGEQPDLFTSFLTIENQTNQATLVGVWTTQVIPLPAAGWLLLSGLAGLGVMARRRKS